MNQRYVLHTDPAWRARANFIVNAPLPKSDSGKEYEQLWLRKTDGILYEVCCIPFFLYDLALGDLVEVEILEGDQYQLGRVAVPSGRYVLRVWFGDAGIATRDEVMRDISDMPVILEWYSSNLLAIDLENFNEAQRMADYLLDAERAGKLVYETGRMR
jgi:hypothetical protein